MNPATRFFAIASLAFCGMDVYAQVDSTLLRAPSGRGMNMDAVYGRPMVTLGSGAVSLGGYMEMNWQHIGTDGVSDGHQFQFRRLTLFCASSIGERLSFLTEIEFEDGAKEISVEYAALDLELAALLNLRGGIVLNPIGAFNQNHDGPKWEFVERPAAATMMLPATLSTAGFGVYGKLYSGRWQLGYEAYLTGGFDKSIIENEENRTFLPASKNNPARFEESASGEPLVTLKTAFRHEDAGEIGISWMGGVYNAHTIEGLAVDDPRRCDAAAVDFNTILPWRTSITGEWAWVFVDVPATYSQRFGSRQTGGFVELIHPVFAGELFGWPEASIHLACRFEYLDWNLGTFAETGGGIADELWSISPAVSFRPVPGSVIRLNYIHRRQRDLHGNPAEITGGLLFGISTYF